MRFSTSTSVSTLLVVLHYERHAPYEGGRSLVLAYVSPLADVINEHEVMKTKLYLLLSVLV
jgi:hypothetical protein